MKKQLLVFLLLAYAGLTKAQTTFSHTATDVLQTIIRDYPHRFNNLQGEALEKMPEVIQYKSTVDMPGALRCTVTHFGNAENYIVYWKALMLKTNRYKDACEKYNLLYKEIANSIVKTAYDKPLMVSGRYTTPEESQPTNCTVFNLLPGNVDMQVKIKLLLRKRAGEWMVVLYVIEKETGNKELDE